MVSFHGEQKIKDAHLAQLRVHAAADEIIQGTYWENGKGCDTGCSFHSGDHSQWEIQLGIPRIIGKLRDRIFEGLPSRDAKDFPIVVSTATPVGKDLQPVWRKLLMWILTDAENGVIKHAKTDRTRKAIQAVHDLLEKSLTENVTEEQFREVRYAAAAAGYAAAAADAAGYARTKTYIAMRDKLIELLIAA